MQDQTAKFLNLSYNKKATFVFAIVALFLLLDRFLKTLALLQASNLKLLSNFFFFQFEKNYNIAFSLPFSGILLLFFISIIICLITILSFRAYQNQSNEIFPLLLVFFGAASNFFDRLRFGFVIDYLYLKHFTVFNIADCLIVCGVIILLFLSLRKK